MEVKGRRASPGGGGAPRGGLPTAPYVAAVEVTAEDSPKLAEPQPMAPYAPWVRSVNDHVRRETTFGEGNRYG